MDGQTDGQTDGQNYDSQDPTSIAASCGKNHCISLLTVNATAHHVPLTVFNKSSETEV